MPSWENFIQQHVLDPNEHPGYATWSKAEWNDWLRQHIRDLKSVNSVVISSPQGILTDFQILGLRVSVFLKSISTRIEIFCGQTSLYQTQIIAQQRPRFLLEQLDV
jgi:hypothetical protein